MATVSVPNTVTVRKVALAGSIGVWKATRVPRASLATALGNVGITSMPPVDHFSALVETGKATVNKCIVKAAGGPIVKWESLSRSAVGVEFFLVEKGDNRNNRTFLFSIGVDKSNRAFVKDAGTHPNVLPILGHPKADATLDALYQHNLMYTPSRDVTEALTGLVMLNRAVRLTDSKGVFFIPEANVPAVDSVFAALNNEGCRCILLQNDLTDPKVRQMVLEATNEQLHDDLAAMQDEMQAILSDPEKKPRINGLQTKMQSLAQHADLLDYYKRMFGTGLETAEKSLSATFELLSELQIRYRGNK